ncbi:MAG: hypothetical protein NTW59_05085 [Candidatus Diapherotrites archaeon]|nr:hypothetical protein [Candidatus Diapherotrites archaeon]
MPMPRKSNRRRGRLLPKRMPAIRIVLKQEAVFYRACSGIYDLSERFNSSQAKSRVDALELLRRTETAIKTGYTLTEAFGRVGPKSAGHWMAVRKRFLKQTLHRLGEIKLACAKTAARIE